MALLSNDVLQGNEFATTYNWNLELLSTGIPQLLVAELGSISGGDPAFNLGTIFGPAGMLDQHCETSGLPDSDVNQANITIRGHKLYQTTTRNMEGDISMEFVERADGRVGQMFEVWKNLTWDADTGRSRPKKQLIVKDGLALAQRTSDDAKVFRRARIRWYYPTSVKISDLGADGGDFQKVSVTFHYGSYKYDLL